MENKKDWTGGKASTFKCLGASNHTDHDRQEHDFYATSSEASEWLLKIEPNINNIWENAVGQGDLAEPIRKAGKLKAVSDIVDRDYYPEGISTKYNFDFLTFNKTWKGDIVTNPPYRCYDKETQVKTKDGWKYFYELLGNEEILSVNPETLELEWSKIVSRHDYNYNGNMIHFKNKLQDLMVTPNHRMFTFKKSAYLLNSDYILQSLKNGDVYTADKVNGNSIHPRYDYKWNGVKQDYFVLGECYKQISKTSERLMPELHILMNSWLKFFGMWLADGCCRFTKNSQGNNRYTVSIKQHSKNYDLIRNILDELPFKYVVYENKGRNSYNFEINSKQLWLYLSQFGKSYDKFIPTFIKELPRDSLQLFLDYYLLGDSFKIRANTQVKHRNSTEGIKISTVSKRLIEDLHEIVLKLGYLVGSISLQSSMKVRYYCFSYYKIKKKQQNYIRYLSKTIVPYNDKVYCVTLEKNGFMLVRRNNKYCFSGNSALEFVKHSLELIQDGHYVCMFLKLTFLEGKERKKFFEENPPIRVWVSSSRILCAMNGEFEKPKKDKNGNIKLDKQGNPIMERQSSAACYAWFVWQKGYKGDTIIKWFN